MSILSWIILLFVALGVLQVGIWVFKGMKALYQKMNGRPGVLATGNNGTAKVRTMQVGRYNAKSEQEDTPWDDLPKYCGETGWFGFAKYKDVVVPNNHYYPSVAYMDTALKQYGYDVMAGWKNAAEVFARRGFKAWGSLLGFPALFSLVAVDNPHPAILITFIWFVVALLALSIVFYFAPAGMRASRRSAEHSRNLTKADWQEVYANVGKQMDHEQEVRIAYTRGRMTGWRY